MPVAWRVTAPQYADSAFSGLGAKAYGGRFNSVGTAVVYAAESLALAMLETLVQAGDRRRLAPFRCISATFEEALVESVEADRLPADWDHRPPLRASQQFGDAWVVEGRSAVLRVPSVVVPSEFNYVFNPAHPDFEAVEVVVTDLRPFDPRLLR